MNPFSTTCSTVALAAALAAVEFNLLRSALRDWQKSRRDDQRRRPQQRSHAASARTRHARIAAAALLGAGALTGPVHAQDAPPTPPTPAPEAAPQAAPNSPYALQLNLDYTNAYFYRGMIQEDTGFILQPAAKLTVNLLDDPDLKLDAFVATWNSFHGQKTAAQTTSDFTQYWYEFDASAGLTLTRDKLSLTATYFFLTSPSDAFETVQELDFTLAYDDTELLGAFALHPYAIVAIETGADGSDGADKQNGAYLELGIAPGFSVDVAQTPIAISFPVSVGFSLGNYYEDANGDDDAFGFAQVGAKASIPLPFNERYGAWTLNAGVSCLFLGDNTAEFNGNDHEQLIATIGLQLNF